MLDSINVVHLDVINVVCVCTVLPDVYASALGLGKWSDQRCSAATGLWSRGRCS